LQALLKQADEEIAGEGHTHTSVAGESQTDEGRNANVTGEGGAVPSDGGVAASSADLEHAPTAEGDVPRPRLTGGDDVAKV
jgi:hypothetical protein